MTEHQQKIVLVISSGMPVESVEGVQIAAAGAEIVTPRDNAEEISAAIPGAAALINCPRHLFTPELLRQAGNGLRWVHIGGAGIEQFLFPEFVESGITLTNGKIIQGPSVADHAMALLLSITRNIHRVVRGQTVRDMPRPLELRGKVMTVIGVGGIGMLIAERAHAFGMKITGVSPEYVAMTSFIEDILPPDRLHEALAASDVVVMAAPVTGASRRMMAAREFSAMKRGGIYVAVSRGVPTDTEALADALNSGHLSAAGLDVTDPEPLADDHPLRAMPNVVITPHIAGPSDHNRERSLALLKANAAQFVAGRPLYNIVDKKLGY